MSETVAIIPARGGSKGIERKNLRRVGGIPLVARAILAAQRCAEINRVVVTTDSEEIAAVAREWRADVVMRPADIAGDEASSESALLHALTELEARGIGVQLLAFLQATSPFIDSTALTEAVRVVSSRRRDVAFSAVQTFSFMWRRGDGGCAVTEGHDVDKRPRRQDREPHYRETGAFYVMRARAFRAVGHRFFGSIGIIEVPEQTAIEIDTLAELEMACLLAPRIDTNEAMDVDALVTDFDGVHTDDTVVINDRGEESVRVSRSDGMGVALLRRANVPVLILSAETNPVVSARAAKLQIEVHQGLDDKVSALRSWAASTGVELSRVAYLGNDVNDLGCLEIVGWPVAVRDAHPAVLSAARVILASAGGSGAVRELADLTLKARDGSASAYSERSTS
ncbi:acylneuraminate cytidylyltransferase [Microbacterium sp. NPDC076911]|uniref:acylneuraminate cytidylyltransferase n=1 Tax=Microbacterium sp. NPDC076911 TaxID=3154958 RepID=UPI003433747F